MALSSRVPIVIDGGSFQLLLATLRPSTFRDTSGCASASSLCKNGENPAPIHPFSMALHVLDDFQSLINFAEYPLVGNALLWSHHEITTPCRNCGRLGSLRAPRYERSSYTLSTGSKRVLPIAFTSKSNRPTVREGCPIGYERLRELLFRAS